MIFFTLGVIGPYSTGLFIFYGVMVLVGGLLRVDKLDEAERHPQLADESRDEPPEKT